MARCQLGVGDVEDLETLLVERFLEPANGRGFACAALAGDQGKHLALGRVGQTAQGFLQLL